MVVEFISPPLYSAPIPETLPHAPLWRGVLAPPRCSDQNEHGTNDSSEDQDGESDLHPDPEVTDCRLDSVPPREHVATLFDQGVDRSLPPSEVLGRVEPIALPARIVGVGFCQALRDGEIVLI